jgi:hypothetical protein
LSPRNVFSIHSKTVILALGYMHILYSAENKGQSIQLLSLYRELGKTDLQICIASPISVTVPIVIPGMGSLISIAIFKAPLTSQNVPY